MPDSQSSLRFSEVLKAVIAAAFLISAVSIAPPASVAHAQPASADLDAWSAARAMGIGVNIGNTLENTTAWETGWGNPPITKAFVQSLAAHGFGVVRVPVAWDTYAHNGQIDRQKMKHVGEVVDWITDAGMFAVINIHWDGGWIDSDDQKKFPKTYHTFSPEAEEKFKSYWTQIATYFANRDQHLIFESLNEESNFENAGSEKKAFATLGRVNQMFIDTVRATGGNNGKRLLIVAGYSTNIDKTTSSNFVLPKDTVPHKLLISVHYYTPWPFVGMDHDESWGKMRMTWGTPEDIAELKEQMDKMEAWSRQKDIPAFIGEFGASNKKDPRSRAKWMASVALSAQARDMVPVLWDIGQDVSRTPPYALTPELTFALQQLQKFNSDNPATPGQ
jgi:endoglucanase